MRWAIGQDRGMSEETSPGRRRRRRRRATRAQGAPDVSASDAPAPVAAPTAPAPTQEAAPTQEGGRAGPVVGTQPRRRRTARDTTAERGLRDLVGAGRSQVGVSGALRARDVNRPTEQDLAEAEGELQIIRRNWKPPAESR
jgi:hypothetical protein